MKAEKIKHITDRESLLQLFHQAAEEKNIFLKKNGIYINVDFIGYRENRIHLRIWHEDYEFSPTIIYVRHEKEIIVFHVIPYQRGNDRIYLFELEGVQVLTTTRKHKRREIKIQNRVLPEISAIISGHVINNSFVNNRSRIEGLRNELRFKLPAFPFTSEIYFTGDREYDSRMEWIASGKKPIYIMNINHIPHNEDAKDFHDYLQNIYYPDEAIRKDGFISEITAPLLFRMIMPFGYIRVNDTSSIAKERYAEIRMTAFSLSGIISKDQQLFVPWQEKLAVADLSYEGIGITFTDSSYMKHFRENSPVILTLSIPDGKKADLLCSVMNISLIDNVFKIGCLIEDIDPIGEINYHEYLAAL